MDTEIKVGPPVITISQGRTFMVTTKAGEIMANSDQGVYAADTRFISFYHLYINRVPLQACQFRPTDLLRCTLSLDQCYDQHGSRCHRCAYLYENTPWKDAASTVVYADGSQVKQPK